ncbi:SdpI family protein [Corynebacterium sp.]|uniref:SdpI family protein n=1 Tax=Corynebacterium sp. TaxID=1720 RepID=UPI002F3F6072
MPLFSIIMVPSYLAGCAILLRVGVKGGSETLPLNDWIGIRTHKTLSSDEAWLTGHKAAAGYLKASSLPMILGGIFFTFASDEQIGFATLPTAGITFVLVMLAVRKAHTAISE